MKISNEMSYTFTGNTIPVVLKIVPYRRYTMKPYMDTTTFDKMVIATSRPKNLRDLLCRTRLTITDDDNVSNII
jgi:hypothetical protein